MTNSYLPSDAVPVRRPHFRLQDNGLHFLISHRPMVQLDEQEQMVWKALDGETPQTALRDRFAEFADRCVARFLDLGLCELVPGHFPLDRRHVVVVEPHMDDAVLSIGGTMWLLREECEFTLVTMTGRSNFTSYYYLERDYLDVDEVSALRLAESALFLRLIGGHHVPLDQLEAPLRYQFGNWSLEWFRRHRTSIGAFIAHCSGAAEIEAWATALDKALRALNPQEIWLPLGIGTHTDHELTRNAHLPVLANNTQLTDKCIIRLYQDVPYAAGFPEHTDLVVKSLTDAGARLEREVVNIGQVMDQKLHLTSIYGSQFKLEALESNIKACAQNASTAKDGCGELFYRMLAAPVHAEPIDLYAEKTVVERLVDKLVPWLHRNRSAAVIHLFLPVPVGRWAEDMGYLLSMFPATHFEVFVGKSCLTETETFTSPRISINSVENSYINWALSAARIAISSPGPLVIIPGRRLENYCRKFSSLRFPCDIIVSPRMNHFVLALRSAAVLQ